ncbi:MAG: diacylglycerol kinase family lipid kinase [Paludibacteraceae bacterium]|nr:diacylglycerol kinase family lipid kinase [Paludibacteraceae bacterium]
MANPKIAFIINPNSGTTDKKALPDTIRRVLGEGYDIHPVFTKYAGHAKEIVRQLIDQGFRYVVACGGDGTVNEIASAMVNTDAAMGIIPFGSGNGLARHLNIPMNVEAAIKLVGELHVQSIDYGMANDHMFFCTCGTGFDAHISHEFSKDGKRGFFTYLKVMAREFWKYKSYVYELSNKNMTIVQKAFLITFANASQYGNNAYIAPHASAQDGRMEVCIMKPFWYTSVPNIAFRLMTKSIEHSRHFSILKTSEVTLRRPCSGEFHIDGDPVMEGKEINIKIIPKALKVICKAGTK